MCVIVNGHAGCAVTAGAQVGLDVEESHRHTHGDPLRLARRRFSAKEIASLEGEILHSCCPVASDLHTAGDSQLKTLKICLLQSESITTSALLICNREQGIPRYPLLCCVVLLYQHAVWKA